MIIGKNLGFDLEQSHALCTQLNQYKEKKSPFDFPFGYEFEEPINWWNVIETKSLPISLPLVALYLFAIALIQLPVEEDSLIWDGLLINVSYN